MQIEGRLIATTEVQIFGSNGFRKREIVLETEEQYPQKILIELVQDKCELVNNLTKGSLLKVSINIKGREWVNPQGETKYFNSIQGWSINVIENASPQQASAQTNQTEELTPKEEHDDLPF